MLKSFRSLAGTVALNETEPYISPSCGPHETMSPFFKSSEFADAIFVVLFSLHDNNTKITTGMWMNDLIDLNAKSTPISGFPRKGQLTIAALSPCCASKQQLTIDNGTRFVKRG